MIDDKIEINKYRAMYGNKKLFNQVMLLSIAVHHKGRYQVLGCLGH